MAALKGRPPSREGQVQGPWGSAWCSQRGYSGDRAGPAGSNMSLHTSSRPDPLPPPAAGPHQTCQFSTGSAISVQGLRLPGSIPDPYSEFECPKRY